MSKTVLLALLFCVLLVVVQVGQAAQWRAYDVDDGLPQNSVVAMTVDRFGLPWVGTEDGLARFDGQKFVAFERAVERRWLPGNYIVALASDPVSIWIAAESGGIARFDLDREHFDILDTVDPDNGQALNAWGLLADGDLLWVGTRDRGVFALEREKPYRIRGHWHKAASDPNRRLDLNAVRDLLPDSEGRGIWVAGFGGVAHIDKTRGRVEHLRLSGLAENGPPADLSNVLDLHDGSVWLGLRSHGVMRRRVGEEAFTSIPAEPAAVEPLVVNRLLHTGTGEILAATASGLYRFDAACDCLKAIVASSPFRKTLAQSILLSAIDTPNHQVWIGTWNHGLLRYDATAPNFDLLSINDLATGDEPLIPRSLFVDQRQRLWIGTFGQGARYATIQDAPMASWDWKTWNGPQGAPGQQIWAFNDLGNGDLFIASDVGLARWNEDPRRVAQIDLAPDRVDETRALFTASDGSLWINSVGGVDRIDPETLARTHFSRKTGLDDSRVYALTEWPRGRLVLGTWSGLFTLPLDGDRIEPFPLRVHGKPYQTSLIWEFWIDSDDGLWIGTSDGLLHLARGSERDARRFGESEGLPNNVVYAIEPHGPSDLWLSTNRGLVQFNRHDGRAATFSVDDGLQGNEFGFSMAAHDAKGRLYFAGLGGVNRFDPEQVRQAPGLPQPILVQFHLNDQVVRAGETLRGLVPLPKSILATDRIRLGWRERDLGFTFSALASESPDHLHFEYRLLGKDPQWIDAGQRRYVGYTNLAPGDYTFEVRATDRYGNRGDPRRLEIELAPPLWATWPFRIGAGLIVLVLLTTAVNWRIAALHRSRQQLADEVARQTEKIRIQNEQLEAANQALFERSIRDPLTGTFNRRHFGELAETAYLGCRARNQDFAMLLLDLDHFKMINDRYGHATGDAVLCAVAQGLRNTLKGQEALARWGGEEFVMMWPNTDLASAKERAMRCCEAVRELRIVSGDTSLRVTASFGLAVATPGHQPTIEALLAQADAALYRAKAMGRDRVEVAENPI